MRIQSVKTFFLNVIMLIWESNLSRMREVCETHLPTASILITILNFNSKILRMVFESSLQVCTGMIFFTNVPMSGQREHLSSLGGSLCSQGQLLQQLLHCTLYTIQYPLYLHFPLYTLFSVHYPLLALDDPTVNIAHLAVCIGSRLKQISFYFALQTVDCIISTAANSAHWAL